MSADIEVHLCAARHHDTNEEINVELVEVYIQWTYVVQDRKVLHIMRIGSSA